MNKILKAIVSSTFVLGTVGAVVAFSQQSEADQPADLQTQIEQGTAHIHHEAPMFERMKPETVEKIKNSWDRALTKIRQQSDALKANSEQWELINYADIDIEFTNDLKQKEAFSFNSALTGDANQNALEVGDYFPAVLVDKEDGKAIVFWERKNGNVVRIDLQSRLLPDGTREWTAAETAQEIDS